MSLASAPFVSIILPTYNRAHCISLAVESVVCQKYTHWELIIVDNFSVDNTKALIEQFNDDRIKFFSFANYGIIASARNFGLSKASGTYAAFLDSDDWWHEDKLLEFSRYFGAKPALIYSDLISVNPNCRISFLKERVIRRRELKSPFSIDLILNINPIVTSTVLVNIKLFKQVGFFNESPEFVTVEDLDAWIKITQISSSIYHIPIPLTYYNLSPDGLSRSSLFIENSRHYFRNQSIPSLGFLRNPSWLMYSQAIYHLRSNSFKKSLFYSRAALYLYYHYRLCSKYPVSFPAKILIIMIISFFLKFFSSLYKHTR